MYDENAKVYEDFDMRLARIARERARMVHGYRAVVAEDGLIVFRALKTRRQMPLRGLVMVLVAGMAFKALVLGAIGDAAYNDRLDGLRSGSSAERFAAVVLAPDAATQFVVTQAKALLN